MLVTDDGASAISAVRRRVLEIYDELEQLPRDAFADRGRLSAERDDLVEVLRAVDADEQTSDRWAQQAPYRPPDTGKPFIASPVEGGGSSML